MLEGSFDQTGIPGGTFLPLGALTDVDVAAAKDGDTIIRKAGLWTLTSLTTLASSIASVAASLASYQKLDQRGVANGYAALNALTQLPYFALSRIQVGGSQPTDPNVLIWIDESTDYS